MEEQRTFGLRQLVQAVNLKDFAQMVGAELVNLGTSARLAFESLRRLPFGPVIFLVAMLLVLLRTLLLGLVVVAFGTTILAITAIRVISRRQSGTS